MLSRNYSVKFPLISKANLSRTILSLGSTSRQLRRAVSCEAPRRSKAGPNFQGRPFSTGRSPSLSNPSDSPIRISHILGALLVFGTGATAWGLYEFYATLTMWPEEVRGDLRAGLRAKERGDMKLSQRHLTKAWQVIQTLPASSLSPDPYLKFSGVAIVLAEVLEADHELDQAYSILKKALMHFIGSPTPSPSSSSTSPPPPPPPDLSSGSSTAPAASASASSFPSSPSPSPPASVRRVTLRSLLDSTAAPPANASVSAPNTRARRRAVALALKLGDLAETLARPAEEERWLGFAVAEVLRIVRAEYGLAHDARRGFVAVDTDIEDMSSSGEGAGEAQGQTQNHEHGIRDILSPDAGDAGDADLGLPAWVSLTKTELAAPMERLGAFYARQGKATNAILLYRVASTLLVQPKSTSATKRKAPPSVQELCQALQIENAHMALLMGLRRARPDEAAIARDLPHVLRRAVGLYDEAVRAHGRKHGAAAQGEGEVGGGEADVALCDETYPAVLFNAGVYYEEESQLQEALRSYSLSYTALRGRGHREQAQEALEGVRRVQRLLDKDRFKRESQALAPSANDAQS